jgi:peptidoglycan-associated lipoprotein
VVQSSGTRQTFPSVSITYTLTAKGLGGTATATATVNVTVPPPPPPPTAPPAPKTLSERLTFEVQDAYFDFDKSHIREDARATLSKNAEALKAIFTDFPAVPIVIEGHCDERGSAEYNLALGDRRAHASKEFLVEFGIPADRLKLISYGKERGQCAESNEDCWQKNRRVHFVPSQ